MKFIETRIKDLFIIEPQVFRDTRGCFFESYNKSVFEKAGLYYKFVQDNRSESVYGVIRGLHFQIGEYSQAKLVTVISGKVLDVAVDLRKESPTFGQYVSVELSGENKRMFMIPRGFAHGFSVLSDKVSFFYKCDNVYHKPSERGLRFNDPSINIDWIIPTESAILSEKDKVLPFLCEIKKNDNLY
ncbi:MAG: dTDP-4-dehydrorhamnose 3,5-epimerase [Alphaproteobacteria bacterium]|nr:dTDP-4-dehydrorhamnose 3,5-epimerase [Alphaproteobacteria bacterium]